MELHKKCRFFEMTKTILVVDDEERITDLLRAYLEQASYRVLTAENGRSGLELARADKPDLIVLDLMMPEMDGVECLRLLRAEQATPVILLTARVEDQDKVLGLELGADDYVTKPFSPRVLLARIRAVMRRDGQAAPTPTVLRVGRLVLDRGSHMVMADRDVIDVTPSEFELLAALLGAPGRVFTRLELLDRIQGAAFEGYERTVDAHVKNLRSKLQACGMDAQKVVETVYGVGYRLRREE